MAIKVGISGFGRIGRVVIRAAMNMPEIEIAALNVRNSELDYLVYQLKYDSTFGRFPGTLDVYENGTTAAHPAACSLVSFPLTDTNIITILF